MVNSSSGNRLFATTHWSVVLNAREQGSVAADALGQLCEAYWKPLYAYLRRQGHPAQDAQDLTQAFFTRLIEKEILQAVAPEKGRFRSFLLACLRNFVANQRQALGAQKRGGGVMTFSLDGEEGESWYQRAASSARTAEEEFDRRWAMLVLERAMDRLRSRFDTCGQLDRFYWLTPFLVDDGSATSYEKLAETLGVSPGAVRTMVHRFRRRYGEALRAEVAQTVASSEDIDEELALLRRAVGR
ncbi:MAG: sigma-70 family RNA polymerase sigma factor [Pirellulaceae bacterium]|nr:sigma-70 family RNA polymerase sigma factor [Planctomycetales bacterium]